MSYLTEPWPQMTCEEKLDAMAYLLTKLADHLPGGKVQELAKFNAIHAREKKELREELAALKKELRFYKETTTKQRNQIASMIPLIPKGKMFKKTTA